MRSRAQGLVGVLLALGVLVPVGYGSESAISLDQVGGQQDALSSCKGFLAAQGVERDRLPAAFDFGAGRSSVCRRGAVAHEVDDDAQYLASCSRNSAYTACSIFSMASRWSAGQP